jgi:dTDP-4-dehydrorhamnose reductase
MKILVLGAGGMAGHVITLRLKEKGHNVTGFARRELQFCETVTGDVRDTELLKKLICGGDFDTVVNAVGILPKAINENPYNGIWINSCLPHFLSEITNNIPVKIIHLSTDCVFSGHDSGEYTEESITTANDYYGRSKALGELKDSKNLTFRMSVVGPDINETGIGLFNWFMKQTGEVSGFTKAVWTGVTTITLSDAVNSAIEQDLTGLYHLVNNENINKYELLKLFNELRTEPVTINPDDTYKADKSLVNTRTDFNFKVPSYSDMVLKMGEWICKYNGFYNQTVQKLSPPCDTV